MLIGEKDLFNYIFYPGSLPKEKYNYISDNEKEFEDEIELIRLTKEKINKDIPENIFNKLLDKIGNLNNNTVIELFKEDPICKENNENYVLAADSPPLEKVLQTDTFKDKDSHYLIKVISTEEQNKIFIFNNDNSELKNFAITLEPSGKSYNIETSSKPFLIKPKQTIEKISLYTDP